MIRVQQDIVLADDAEFDANFEAGLLGGVTVLTGIGTRTIVPDSEKDRLYTTAIYESESVPLKAIPYFAWSNRTTGEMSVWLRSR